ncbi:hypothetical protein [Streptomyces prunicolor]|uniref:hypothetical protein n=1 Tax=Streptomyces prunicolor TaxID=67348 RepID=UPI0033D6353E
MPLELLLALIDNRSETDPVPVRLSPAEWDTSVMDLENFLVRHLVQSLDRPPRLATRLVRHRLVLPVLDGLDEMDPLLGSTGRGANRSRLCCRRSTCPHLRASPSSSLPRNSATNCLDRFAPTCNSLRTVSAEAGRWCTLRCSRSSTVAHANNGSSPRSPSSPSASSRPTHHIVLSN